MTYKLISSPLQGFTDFKFRNVFNKHFGGIDTFYAPYIRLNDNLEMKSSNFRDILPVNNSVAELIPQVLTNDAEEFLIVAKDVQELGYSELNWNLGCPSPTVVKRELGSGLLPNADKIDSILSKVYSESDISVSIKMRLGFDNSDDIFKILPVLEKYPIKNIAIHARIGKQMYKGNVDLESFKRCISSTKHKLIYNGDITTVSKFIEMQNLFPEINTWMLGRGIIADPFLPQMIKTNVTEHPENCNELFKNFHNELYETYAEALSGPSHLLTKMFHFWEYFSMSFTNSHKVLKKFKKAKTLNAYRSAVSESIREERFVGVR
jgi:tRNA-dihydrouridine synthase